MKFTIPRFVETTEKITKHLIGHRISCDCCSKQTYWDGEVRFGNNPFAGWISVNKEGRIGNIDAFHYDFCSIKCTIAYLSKEFL